jgi:hypothetical protein
MHTPIRTADI